MAVFDVTGRVPKCLWSEGAEGIGEIDSIEALLETADRCHVAKVDIAGDEELLDELRAVFKRPWED